MPTSPVCYRYAITISVAISTMRRLLPLMLLTIACAQLSETASAQSPSFSALDRSDSHVESLRDAIVVRARLITGATSRFFSSNERYPSRIEELGLPPLPPSTAIAGLEIQGPQLRIQLAPEAGGGVVRYTHRTEPGHWNDVWICTSTNRPDVSLLLPGCVDERGKPTLQLTDARWGQALRRELRDELQPIASTYSRNLREVFASTGSWPASVEWPILPTRWVESARILPVPQRGFEIALSEGKGGAVRYSFVSSSEDPGDGYFTCSSERPDIEKVLPGCVSLSAARDVTSPLPDRYFEYAKSHQIREELLLNRAALTSLTEYFMAYGRWPATLREGGVSPFQQRHWFAAEQYLPALYMLTLNARGGGGDIVHRYAPRMPFYAAAWTCTSSRIDIQHVAPDCAGPDGVRRRPDASDADLYLAHRAQISQDLGIFRAIGVAIEEHFAAFGVFPSLAQMLAYGYPAQVEVDHYGVRQISIGADVSITVHLSPVAGLGSLRWSPRKSATGGVEWLCRSDDREDAASLWTNCQHAGSGR